MDPVYLAFVWGLDLEAKIIKTFEFSDQGIGELCRTFQFDDSQTSVALSPQNLPNDYPALRKVAKFDWMGLVELPVASPPSEDAVAAKEELLRKRKRFSNILAAAPSLFEIGIGGDCAIVVGELTLHPPGSPGSVTIENCKRGIWEVDTETRLKARMTS
ncbi:hypothetical protein BDZ97DRAFT_1925270 [Flammula alnicola]|nr:hypothetical protein BDZ97DRAFT_1925270 [Flammula alnicola]